MKQEAKIKDIQLLSAEEAKWYGYNSECFIVRFDGFAPMKYAKIVNGKYESNPETGYIHGNGNTGTSSMLMSLSNSLFTASK